MKGPYARFMERWELKLATRDTNRVVRPFDWGTDWLHSIGFPNFPQHVNGDAPEHLSQFIEDGLGNSDRFYQYEAVRDYSLQSGELTFTSPVRSPYPQNDKVHARWFPAEKDQGRALIVLPQFNSGPDGHVGLAKLLNRF